ncbi:MAG: ATP-binding protein [Gammaproteobacteria bacterium]
MNYWKKVSAGVGRVLILSIGTVLFLTMLSVYVATIAINKIDMVQENLSNQSIPALVDVSNLSSLAIDIIKQSQLMNAASSVDEINSRMNKASLSSKNLLDNLKKVKTYGLENELTIEIEAILNLLNKNIIELYELKSNKLNEEEGLAKKINLMRKAIETIEDKASLMKINTDHEFLQRINNMRTHELNIVRGFFHEEINNIELISDVIMRSGELRKDLNAINNALDKESVLFIQQEFNHSLRKIIRIIVQSKKVNFHQDIRNNIATLIKYGQDSPDIFDVKKLIISTSQRLEMIAQENIVHTQQFNTAIFLLASQVKSNAETASDILHNTIIKSQNLLYLILFIALVVSLIITWKFIYKGIVVKLSDLSLITKKLGNNDFLFEINTKGDDELSDIAAALESLREHSLKRIYLNKALEENSLKLKQSNEDLSQFAYIASHDLQEPLRMVGSYVQLIKERYKGKLDDASDTYIDFAVDGCLRMKLLIEGLLEYSRVESSNEEKQDIDCNLLLQEVIHDLSVHIKERNAEIIIRKLPNIYAVPSQMRMIFSNMVNNALKYCEKDVPRVEIQSTSLDGMVKFSIKDNGIGIKPRYQEKIFVIFKRLHSRAEYSGTGIGLSICKKIIERHGGTISLDSEFGRGTTFFFTLPG